MLHTQPNIIDQNLIKWLTDGNIILVNDLRYEKIISNNKLYSLLFEIIHEYKLEIYDEFIQLGPLNADEYFFKDTSMFIHLIANALIEKGCDIHKEFEEREFDLSFIDNLFSQAETKRIIEENESLSDIKEFISLLKEEGLVYFPKDESFKFTESYKKYLTNLILI